MSISTEILILVLPITAALLVANFQLHKELREQDIRLKMYDADRFAPKYRKLVKFINTDNAGDNDTLNRSVQKLLDEGYAYRKDKSTDKMLAFVKHERIKEDGQ